MRSRCLNTFESHSLSTQISLQWNSSSHSFFSCKYYEITLIVSKLCCPGTPSLVLDLLCSSRQHLQRASYWAKLLLGQFGDISAAVCSQNSSTAGEQHRATCVGSLCNKPRFSHILSGALHLKMRSYWNRFVIPRNYCNNPKRNHKQQTWNPDCLQLNTNNRSILHQLAFVKLLS